MTEILGDHYNPVNITVGQGALKSLNKLISTTGKILLVTTSGFTQRGVVESIQNECSDKQFIVYDQVTPNPELDDLDEKIALYRNKSISSIIALGGGSVLDAAKVLAVALSCQIKKPLDELFRKNKEPQWGDKLPLIAIPSTSGTGAEVTPFATVWDSAHNKKYSLSGKHVFPDRALLDPCVTLTLPYDETLNTALDAISHSLESLWNKNRTPLSESFAIKSLLLSKQALPILLEDLSSLEQREKMQLASLYAGLAISHTRTAIAHSISYPLTSYYGVPHGLACSFTLPTIIERYLIENDTEINAILMNDIKQLLLALDLKSKIKKYIDIELLKDIYQEMYSPERADNFMFDITLNDIEKTIAKSLI